ncbi:hypothetical protein E2C01_073948 [Portunus trituberculatus]|uniref:Uncharacterized protein n=1 Tax=Portunus trituberculatus TaxID=210409 RepID=A0A5B7I4B1_PORTR|nr:hypothetical protein [Portunus trituberculatus]
MMSSLVEALQVSPARSRRRKPSTAQTLYRGVVRSKVRGSGCPDLSLSLTVSVFLHLLSHCLCLMFPRPLFTPSLTAPHLPASPSHPRSRASPVTPPPHIPYHLWAH